MALGFTSQGGIFSDAIYVAVEGKAELIRDQATFKAHWTSDFDRWFVNGVDTPNIVLIKIKASRITYWGGEDEGGLLCELLSCDADDESTAPAMGRPSPPLTHGDNSVSIFKPARNSVRGSNC